MIMIWLMKAWQGLLKLLELALKHWRITLAVIACVAVYAHAVLAHKRVTALEDQIIGYQATIDQYKRTEAVLRQAAVPVPDAVADQLRNY